ncbi:MAG TPA: PAS domain-containing protein [Brevundimonas sp.]|jgi:signal transduction histidine kinase/PAS domain-containing protein|uniref:PAS domain-containing sensor histidine kinase n=1 Tax=Brevundimonas sp. TaxID=1871086 RepID=UPI002E13709D|nr:PAS domain-containing protein [Brevundimonas sp.]
MFLEGEIDWVVLLAVVAAVSLAVALIAGFYAITRGARHEDVSGELAAAREAAGAAQRRLLEVLNAVPVALVETDAQGKFVFANRAAHQLLGRRDAELLGLRFHSATWGITYPDGRPIPPDLLPNARALRGQTVKGFQHILANPANRKRMLVSVTAMPMEDARGQIIGSIAAIVETEGLTTPEPVMVEAPPPAAPAPAAAAESDLLRQVFEAATAALVVIGPDGRVRETNRQTRALMPGQPLDGGDFTELFLNETDRAPARQALRAALQGEPEDETALAALRSPHLGEGVVWRVLPLGEAGGRPGALLLAGERATDPAEAAPPTQDGAADAPAPETPAADTAAAEARVAELSAALDAARAELAAAERLSAAEREQGRRLETVGRLTGGVAQDFAALLSVMTSALDLLAQQAEDPARVRRLAQAALTAGQKGEVLTRRLSAFSQGEEAPAAQRLDAGVLLRGLEPRLRRAAGEGVDLLIEGPAAPLELALDPVGLEAALVALVRNAVEARGSGPASVAVRLAETVEAAEFSVIDMGHGMDAETRARAVEPFFTTRPGQAGLGLSEAHAFARQSGGRLELESAPGEGTTVRLVLPRG